MIQTTQELAEFLDGSNGEFHALDTEADSLHCYHEKLCLIQYSDGERHTLIDPLAIEDLEPLKQLIRSSEIWMHGADYDIMLMRRDLDAVPPVVWDTQIAARLLGVRKFGYANLVEHFLGVELSKGSQKADWSKRPLTEKMMEYAINDVFYLKPMVELLLKQLREKGRYEWFVESCEQARAKVLDRPQSKEDPWRIQGAGKLNPKGLLFLRALWYWRDAEASDWDKPPFMVCGNKQLLGWVNDICNGRDIELPKHFRSSRRKNFYAAVEKAKQVPENLWPKRQRAAKRRIKDEVFENRCAELAAKRDQVATDLDIDSALIISKAAIESIAAKEVEPAEILMAWQCQLLDL
ncbi:ribonuclease D [Rubritalea tangerina]|uniref:Ribonuclease D n=1 Tax=Rubritalea tangerina TaxID=430798 RepID=A0ABW4ZEJ6_9BACT